VSKHSGGWQEAKAIAKAKAARGAAYAPVAGKLSLQPKPISTDVRLNLLVKDGRLQKHLTFCYVHIVGQRLEEVEKVRARINLRLIRYCIAVVAHCALAPRSQIPPGILEP
jgi:hypothetical protein